MVGNIELHFVTNLVPVTKNNIEHFRLIKTIPYFMSDFPESKYDHLKWSYENISPEDGNCSLRSCIPEHFVTAVANPVSNIING